VNNLGICYRDGIGVPPNADVAMRYLRAAAAQGFAEAEYNIGLMYERGIGIYPNGNEAALWYRRATDRGHTGAQTQHEQLVFRTLLKTQR
jgi:TPR repeat protein